MDQATQIDAIYTNLSQLAGRTPEAEQCRVGFIAWYEGLGYMQKHGSPKALEVAKGKGRQFVRMNGDSIFGAERPVLRQGSSGSSVVDLQKAIGVSPADGKFGPGTKAKLIDWQKKNGLTADGVAGALTWSKIDNAILGTGLTDADREKVMGLVALTAKDTYDKSQQQAASDKKAAILKQSLKDNVPGKVVGHPTLRRGSRGDAVKEWQLILGNLKTDGVFGPATETQTKTWQSQRGLKPDGVVGPQAWMAAYASNTAKTNAPLPAAVVDTTQTLPIAKAPTPATIMEVIAKAPPVAKRPVGSPIPPKLVPSVIKKAPVVAPSLQEVLASPATATGTNKISQAAMFTRLGILVGAVFGGGFLVYKAVKGDKPKAYTYKNRINFP